MPARQRGSARKRGDKYLATWYENGDQRTRGGFTRKTDALDYAGVKANEEVARQNALRFGDPEVPKISTVNELVDAFLARHLVDEATLRKMRSQLKHARRVFGDRPLHTLQPIELDLWRATELPTKSAHYPFRAFRQVLEYAVAMGLVDRNPTERIKNPRTNGDARANQNPFEDWDQVESLAAEMSPRFAAIPIVLVGTGLRPEELWPLERGIDVDLDAGVIDVSKVYTQGVLKLPKKSSRQRRRVPLRGRVVDALRAMPPRIDTKLQFPAARGGFIDIEKFRHREWAPAFRAAGIERRRIYDCRHTFASWALDGDKPMDLLKLARVMGTSVAEIDRTYAHLMPDAEGYVRGLLDGYDDAFEAAKHAHQERSPALGQTFVD